MKVSDTYNWERAKTAALSRDFELAKRLYNQILQSEPDNIEILTQLANVFVRDNDDQSAMEIFLKIIQLDSKNFTAMDNLGAIYRRIGRYKESIDILNEALKIGKNTIMVQYNLGQTYKLMGDYTKAQECFIAVIDINPHDVLAFNHLGCIYALKNEHENAVKTFQQALQIDPNHPVLHFNNALSLQALEKNEEAENEYQKALRSKPDWNEVVIAYADLLTKMKKFDAAENLLQKHMPQKPEDICASPLPSPNELNAKPEEQQQKTIPEKVKTVLGELRQNNPDESVAYTAQFFEYLRKLCTFLPPLSKERFESSTERMFLEYIIKKLNGRPGLKTETEAVKQILQPQKNDTIAQNQKIDNKKLDEVIVYLRSLTGELPDKKLAAALDSNIVKVLSQLEKNA